MLPPQELGAQVQRVRGELGDGLHIRRRGIPPDDRDHPLAVLARAFRHQLLDPVGEPRNRRRRPERHLVAPAERRRGYRATTLLRCLRVDAGRAREQLRAVHLHQRRRQHAHDGQRRVAPADIRRMREDRPKARPPRKRLQGTSGIGDRDELPGGGARREVAVRRERLNGGAGLAGDEE